MLAPLFLLLACSALLIASALCVIRHPAAGMAVALLLMVVGLAGVASAAAVGGVGW